jgi:hypothetical protein
MDFQNTVNLYNAAGIPGAHASANPIVSTPKGYIAGADLPIGGFAWEDGNGSAVPTGTGSPIGFVVRDIACTIMNIADSTQEFVPAGENVNVAARGDFWAVSSTAATVGQHVFAKLADGSLSTAAPGAAVAGSVETGYVVAEGGAAGDVIIISNWGAGVTVIVNESSGG